MPEPNWSGIFSRIQDALSDYDITMKGRPEVQESWQDLEGNEVGVISIWYKRPKDEVQ